MNGFGVASQPDNAYQTLVGTVESCADRSCVQHALIASDYAITLINLMYPGDLEEVRKEREIQIELMKSV